MKTYQQHKCEAAHRTEQTFLRCAIPRVAWIAGHGKFALIAWCSVPTITLHQEIGPALENKSFIDKTRCGGRCTKRHEVVLIDRGAAL